MTYRITPININKEEGPCLFFLNMYVISPFYSPFKWPGDTFTGYFPGKGLCFIS